MVQLLLPLTYSFGEPSAGGFIQTHFDFRCQRPNGTYYGTAGVCRKGVEVGDKETPSKSGKVSAQAKAVAEKVTEAQLAAAKVSDRQTLAENLTRFEEETSRYVELLKNGSVSQDEMDRMIIEHLDSDAMKTEFLFIGMENGLNPDFPGEEYGSNSAGQFTTAKMLAQDNLVRTGQMSLSDSGAALAMIEIANRNETTNKGKLDKPANLNEYIGSTTSLAVQASGGSQRVSRELTDGYFFGFRKLSTIEMSVPAATSVVDGTLNKSGQPTTSRSGNRSNDPNRSMYGAMISGQAGPKFTGYDRAYVKREFQERRTQFIAKTLQKAGQSPTLQGGFGAPGSGAKYTDFVKGIIDPLASSGTPVYTTEVKLSTGKAGGGTTTKTHALTIAEIGPGKHFVVGDFSMNTQGYAANNNQFKAYQAGIKAVQTGTATRYVPTKSTSSTSKSSKPRPTATNKPAPKPVAPVRTGASQKKLDLRRALQKARREGRAADALKLEKTLKKLK